LVLDAIRKVIDPGMVAEAVERAVATLTARHAAWDAQHPALDDELKEADARLNRVVQAIVKVGSSDALVAQLKIEEQRQRDCAPASRTSTRHARSRSTLPPLPTCRSSSVT
jgi:hypothetical protein